MALAAAAAIAAAAAVGVVSAFFALYALVEPQLGAPGAAAVVSASAAVLVAVAGYIAARKVDGDRRRNTAQSTPDATLVDTILSLVRERPLLASGAAVAAGIYALRNPQLIAAVLRAFMDKPSPPKR
ncbi:MAG: hypothetical protein Q7J28_08735 [Caulobacter sp.]|nr:hypothetical protein [Caulobacter sp.]